MTRILYELLGKDDRRFSPFCWRTRMALAHKGLELDEIIPIGFTEKEKIAFSGQDRVPVLVDNGKTVFDSWKIACYLEETYPDRPPLFGSEAARGEALFINHWTYQVLLASIFPMVVLDIFNHVRPEDQEYFRSSREKVMGDTLEAIHATRDARFKGFHKKLDALRLTLQTEPFLCGESPAYGDYIVFSIFQWVRCISTFPFLEADDPIYAWRKRMFGLFDGLTETVEGYPC